MGSMKTVLGSKSVRIRGRETGAHAIIALYGERLIQVQRDSAQARLKYGQAYGSSGA